MAGWVSPLGPLPPAPEGPLTTQVTCRTAARGRGVKHDITLAADWSLTTPHDLDAERILAAFGGTLSCIALNDVVVPALHDLVQLSARRHLAGVRRTDRNQWILTCRTCPRCHDRGFRTPADAARHERTLDHWVGATRADKRTLGRLYDVVGQAHDTAQTPRPRQHPMVLEVGGVSDLWDAGIPVEFVEHVHGHVWPDGPALPVALYLSAAYLLPDLDWLAAVARERQDPDVLTWAAWSECDLDRHKPESRLQWLALGLSVRDVQRLMTAGYTADDAEEYADLTRQSVRRAATTLAAWHAADCVPGPVDLAALNDAAPDAWRVPSGGAVDLLEHDARGLRPLATRTQIGLVLAVAGTRAMALSLLRRGVRDPLAAARWLDQSLPVSLGFDTGAARPAQPTGRAARPAQPPVPAQPNPEEMH